MPRKRKPPLPPRQPGVPAYRCKRVNGYEYGVVSMGGRDRYLGKFGDPASIAEYNQLVGRWLANDRSLPEEPVGAPLSVNEVLLKYTEHCERHYAARRRFKSLMSRIKVALRGARELYGLTSAADFGPKRLQLVREHWIKSGLSRTTINEHVQTVRRCFAWAVAEELVPPTVWQGLKAVGGLRRGDAKVPEPKKVGPVPDAYVDAIQAHVSKQVWAMVQLQRLTGMRSGEVCIMRTRDMDTSGKLWTYRPERHKADIHGHTRTVYLGPQAQEVLRPWLRTALDESLFQPAEVVADLRKQRHENRKTPLHHGNRPGKRRLRGKKRLPGKCYSPGTYRNRIFLACDKAGVPRWHPHQLRHSYATRVRREHGVEVARVMLGHRRVSTSELYAEANHGVAADVAAKLG